MGECLFYKDKVGLIKVLGADIYKSGFILTDNFTYLISDFIWELS